ncbi:MAG TPA: AI-2E family transporter [Anaerolineales bacterium]|nr:AI-2E family transporter [Anaerolineales bacterium]
MTQDTVTSPRWGNTTKLLIGLVIVGILAFLINRFASLITPLLFIFILAYLLHPLTSLISRRLGISWRASVNILYLVIIILLIALITVGGVGLVQQVQSLITSIQNIVANLPTYIETLSGKVFQVGPFQLDMSNINLNELSRQLLAYVQPLLGRTGNLLSAVAGGAAEVVGWGFFILIVSYFVMAESSGLQRDLIKVELPGYGADFRRLGSELSRIWNAFLRGQILIFVLASVIYIFVLSILGVRYAIGLAIMAGLAKFLPYIGPAITWVVMALVTFFQLVNPFDLAPWTYALIVVSITLVIDQIIDSLVVPRIMARTLKVHPAAVLVTALIAANLMGLLGVVIAAPFLASVTLLGKYVVRKMFDLEPWPEKATAHYESIESEWLRRIKRLWHSITRRKNKKQPEPQKEPQDERQSQ